MLEPLIQKEKALKEEQSFSEWLLGRNRSDSKSEQLLSTDEIKELEKELSISLLTKEL